MNFHSYIEKLRTLPDKYKKVILWIIVAILGLVMAAFWINSAKQRISQMGQSLKEEVKVPQVEAPK